MQTSDFHYDLPPERIAQHPASPRDGARMLVCEQEKHSTRHRIVRELVDELREGDLLVVNDTRVRPARMEARRSTGGAVELLFVEPLADGAWRTMVRPAKKLRPGEELEVGEGLRARAILRETDAEGEPSAFWRVELSDPASPGRSVEERRQLAGETLGRVGLSHRVTHPAGKLSGGERQRVAVARAILGRPDIVLADEPTGNLDSRSSEAIVELLEELNADGITMLVITHNPEIADRFARQVSILDGRIESDSALTGRPS